jgi:hypothetical protein
MNFDEVNTRIDQPMEPDIDLMSYNKTVNDFQFRWIQGLINPWNMIFTSDAYITFHQRTLLGTSTNQKRHYLKSYNNRVILYTVRSVRFSRKIISKTCYNENITKCLSENVFSDWLMSLVTFFDETLYSTRKKSRELNITFQHSSRRLKIEMVFPNYLKSSSQSSFTEMESH